MTNSNWITVAGYELALDRFYDQSTHLWVQLAGAPSTVRVGFDPLGRETSGDIVAVSFETTGTVVERGAPFGTIEAAKFVGPLASPVTGTIVSHNLEVCRAPSLLAAAPLRYWMVEIELTRGEGALRSMLSGEDAIGEWFEAEVRRARDDGMIAE